MLDEFGAEIEHADTRLDATMKKMAKVLHLSDGNSILYTYLHTCFTDNFSDKIGGSGWPSEPCPVQCWWCCSLCSSCSSRSVSGRSVRIISKYFYRETCDLFCLSCNFGSSINLEF